MSDETATGVTLAVPEGAVVLAPLWGPQDSHRRLLEKQLGVRLRARGERLTLSGRAERLPFAERVIAELLGMIRSGAALFMRDIEQAINLLGEDGAARPGELRAQTVVSTFDHRSVSPKTPNQQLYMQAVAEHDLVFAVGPAGTGKTYLAMACAVAALKQRAVERIILARPAVEAGERLGFLPGTLSDKVDPYLRPLYDALFDLLGAAQAAKLVENGTVEVAPLAYMRGRTLNGAFVILDEAQNATVEQMKMCLTRLGHGSRAIVTGDVTQVDLDRGRESGLIHAVRVLGGVEGIAVVNLTSVDVVRHALVQRIVRAYDRDQGRTGE